MAEFFLSAVDKKDRSGYVSIRMDDGSVFQSGMRIDDSMSRSRIQEVLGSALERCIDELHARKARADRTMDLNKTPKDRHTVVVNDAYRKAEVESIGAFNKMVEAQELKTARPGRRIGVAAAAERFERELGVRSYYVDKEVKNEFNPAKIDYTAHPMTPQESARIQELDTLIQKAGREEKKGYEDERQGILRRNPPMILNWSPPGLDLDTHKAYSRGELEGRGVKVPQSEEHVTKKRMTASRR